MSMSDRAHRLNHTTNVSLLRILEADPPNHIRDAQGSHEGDWERVNECRVTSGPKTTLVRMTIAVGSAFKTADSPASLLEP